MKNKLALGMMGAGIFGIGLATGIVLSKCVMRKRGVIL